MIHSIIRRIKWKKPFILLFWILLWEGLFLLIDREIYLPSPVTTFQTLFVLLGEPETYLSIGYSVYRTLLSLLLSVVLGVALGILGGLKPVVHDFLNPLVIVLRSVPIVSVIILAIIWFASTNVPVFAGFLMCFPLMYTSALAGVRSTDAKLLEMSELYCVSMKDRLRFLYFPSAVSHINTGIVSALGIAWKAVAAAEVLSLPQHSVGFFLYKSKTWLDPASLFAWTMIIIALSYLFEFLFKKAIHYDKAAAYKKAIS